MHRLCEYTRVPACSTASSDEHSQAIAAPVTSGGAPRNRLLNVLVAGLVVGGEAGVDVEGDEALRRELHVQLPGDAQERGLRRAVAEPPPALARGRGWVHGGGGRRHVHDATAAAFEHARHDELDEVELVDVVADHELGRGVEVELEHAVHPTGPLVDRVVDQRVDASPFVEHGVDHGVDRRAVEEVHRHRERALARGPRWPAAVESRLPSTTVVSCGSRDRAGRHAAVALVHRARRDGDVVACVGERERGGPSDAPARAGHESDGSSGHERGHYR